MTTAPEREIATIEDALARPESDRIELIRGTLVRKAMPTLEHSEAQTHLASPLTGRFNRRPGGRWPGGWWIRVEADIQLGDELFRPDICGWRREGCAERPKGRPFRVRPDWIFEVLSPSTEEIDRVDKLQSYHRAGVPHYWMANPLQQVLEVYRHAEPGYLLVLSAKAGQRIRPEPFDAVEFRVDELFGADPEDD